MSSTISRFSVTSENQDMFDNWTSLAQGYVSTFEFAEQLVRQAKVYDAGYTGGAGNDCPHA
jgi:hypothetical protein